MKVKRLMMARLQPDEVKRLMAEMTTEELLAAVRAIDVELVRRLKSGEFRVELPRVKRFSSEEQPSATSRSEP